MEKDIISYNLNEIENISMTNGKLEFKLKKKEIEEKKPKIDKIEEGTRKLISQYYDNYFKFKKVIKTLPMTIVENEVENHINHLKGYNNNNEQSIRNCFEHAVAYFCSILFERIEMPWEIHNKIEAYERAIKQPYPELGKEIEQKILDEAKLFVTEKFSLAYKYIIQRKKLTNEDIRERYDECLKDERDEKEYKRQSYLEIKTKLIKQAIEGVTIEDLN